MPDENGSHDTPALDVVCQMVCIKDINKTTTEGQEVKLTGKEVADTIAAQVEQATGLDCEAYANEAGAVVVFRHTTVIARISPLFDIMDGTPVGGTFDGENVEVPLEVRTVDGLRQMARSIDEAASHALSAAMDGIRRH